LEYLFEAIRTRDISGALDRVFERTQRNSPSVRAGFRRESEAWDFKAGLPGLRHEQETAWAGIAADLLAFHNAKGGILFFGIRDSDYSFVGTRDPLDGKRFNDKVRRYIGDTFWVEFSREFIQEDQRYLGVALVPPRGLVPLRIHSDAPADKSGRRIFQAGDLCIREGDSTRIFTGTEADRFLRERHLPVPTSRYLVDEPAARILKPDWKEFISRTALCDDVERGINDDRTYVTALSGVGGIGKTAVACWAVLRAHEKRKFEFIVSVTAKDRELSSSGIRAVQPTLGSFDDLLNEILHILGFSECTEQPVDEREKSVRELLAGTRTLLFVDNLETVEDRRVVQFLETLPLPVKAITTSRVATIRTAAFPVSVGPFTPQEALVFFDYHAKRAGRYMLCNGPKAERELVVKACALSPLAIEWLIGQAPNMAEAMSLASVIQGAGKKDEELLEFCFRRVHSRLSQSAQRVLSVLALDDRPQRLEALSVAATESLDQIDVALGELERSSLVERCWDPKIHDFTSRCLGLTRRFAYRDLARTSGREAELRRRLADWYEGRDIRHDSERSRIVAIRRGTQDPEAMLVDAAISYRQQGKVTEAEEYFTKAINRNPRSWRAHREYAELLRDRDQMSDALEHYEQAGANAPKAGAERALVFREWAALLRRSGQPDAHEQAIEKLNVAVAETPDDQLALHMLATCRVKCGHYKAAMPILERLVQERSAETRARSYPLLKVCYEKLGEVVKVAELRGRIEDDHEAARVQIHTKRSMSALRSGAAALGSPSRNRDRG
jgi:tetratricopeptide (TPR) repeat protein